MSIAVLLVEDAVQLRRMVADLLAGVGDFTIVGAVGTEAEAKLWLDENRGKWDLAVIDLILEQGTGMGVIGKCKEEPHTKVVVFSDYATPGIHKHCLQLGADAVFQKSSDVGAFLAWCAALVPPATAQPS